jgi:hypothetical protein
MAFCSKTIAFSSGAMAFDFPATASNFHATACNAKAMGGSSPNSAANYSHSMNIFSTKYIVYV